MIDCPNNPDSKSVHGGPMNHCPRSNYVKPDMDIMAPLPELEGSYPIVLYFETSADRDEFMSLVHEAKPGMVTKKL